MIVYLYTSEDSESLALDYIKDVTFNAAKLQPSMRGAIEYKVNVDKTELKNLVASIESNVPYTWIQLERMNAYGDAISNIGIPSIQTSGYIVYSFVHVFYDMLTVPVNQRWIWRGYDLTVVDADDRTDRVTIKEPTGNAMNVDVFTPTTSRAYIFSNPIVLEELWKIQGSVSTFNAGGLNWLHLTVLVDVVTK